MTLSQNARQRDPSNHNGDSMIQLIMGHYKYKTFNHSVSLVTKKWRGQKY